MARGMWLADVTSSQSLAWRGCASGRLNRAFCRVDRARSSSVTRSEGSPNPARNWPTTHASLGVPSRLDGGPPVNRTRASG